MKRQRALAYCLSKIPAQTRSAFVARENRDPLFRIMLWDLSIYEHHGLAAVQDDAIVEVIADCARQHAPLDVAPLAHEVVGRVAVADALDVLVDDRSLIEDLGDVMGGRADQLDAALMGLVLGLLA